MSSTISTNFAKQYEPMFQTLAQQSVSYFKDKVKVKIVDSANQWYMDQIGAVSDALVTGQRQAISLGDTPHTRRQITKASYYFADTVEERDLENMLSNPTADYTQNGLRALERRMDTIIIAAAFASANTGVDGGTAVAFSAEGKTIASGSTGLTFAKLLEVRKTFQKANVPFTKINLAIGPEQEEDLYNLPEFINRDFREKGALDNTSGMAGFVADFMEFSIWRTTGLTLGGSTRDCIAWVDGGIGMIIGISPKVIIENRPDLVGSPTQVQVLMSAGAARLEGNKVIKLQCDE